MLNGATPMFSKRVSVVGASLVCRVDITRWPVCAALIAMSAVSRSRISPTMITSGSWRRNDFNAAAERQACLVVDIDLIDAGQVDFSRILDGRDVDARLIQNVQAGVQRHGLAAEPVGPVTRIIPYGRWMACIKRSFSIFS